MQGQKIVIVSCLEILKLIRFPYELEEKGGRYVVQMEIQLQLARQGTASGTLMSSRGLMSSHGSLYPLPLQRVITSTRKPCSDRAVLWCQHWASFGGRRCCSRGFLKQPLSIEECWVAARREALHPCGPERATSLCAAAKALGSCPPLAEIIVEFADSARRQLNTCSQVVCPISTAVGYEKHAGAFICNNRALLKYCKLKMV